MFLVYVKNQKKQTRVRLIRSGSSRLPLQTNEEQHWTGHSSNAEMFLVILHLRSERISFAPKCPQDVHKPPLWLPNVMINLCPQVSLSSFSSKPELSDLSSEAVWEFAAGFFPSREKQFTC